MYIYIFIYRYYYIIAVRSQWIKSGQSTRVIILWTKANRLVRKIKKKHRRAEFHKKVYSKTPKNDSSRFLCPFAYNGIAESYQNSIRNRIQFCRFTIALLSIEPLSGQVNEYCALFLTHKHKCGLWNPIVCRIIICSCTGGCDRRARRLEKVVKSFNNYISA